MFASENTTSSLQCNLKDISVPEAAVLPLQATRGVSEDVCKQLIACMQTVLWAPRTITLNTCLLT